MKIRNSISLIGRLGQDPELKQLESGSSVCKFSLATSEKYTNKQGQKVEDTQWHTCIAWNKLAGIINDISQKGDEVAVRGKMTYRKWNDKEGITRYSAEVVVDEFLQLTQKAAQPHTTPAPATTLPTQAAAAPSKPKATEDDLPF